MQRYGSVECSVYGSPFFSSATAKLTLFNEYKAIDDWYFSSLRFGNRIPINRFDPLPGGTLQGHNPTHFCVNNRTFRKELLPIWYDYLWYLYLEEHPDVTNALRSFSSYLDNTAETIRNSSRPLDMYFNNGRELMIDYLSEFEWLLLAD
ncbi:hypothetical protein [Paenibacillus sp. 1A_MP2]|uniref:hypothetical protein n=1 Tax=Paenibacillus sp. 1A_MP2 TaxID=3457495 RepID=UPI003FCC860B